MVNKLFLKQDVAEDTDLACEACGRRTLQRFVVPQRASLLYCPGCELYQKGNLPDPDSYEIDYHSHYIDAPRRKLRKARVRLEAITIVLGQNERPRLLDIGCSVGWTVQAAQDMGCNAHGVDISAGAVAVARDRGLSCQAIDGIDLPFADNSFDVITAWHVIEHVPCVSATLHEWRRVLRPNGLLAIETPDASSAKVRRLRERYPTFWKPEHTYVFSPQNLLSFLANCGFCAALPPSLLSATRKSLPLLFDLAHSRTRQVLGISKAFTLFARKSE